MLKFLYNGLWDTWVVCSLISDARKCVIFLFVLSISWEWFLLLRAMRSIAQSSVYHINCTRSNFLFWINILKTKNKHLFRFYSFCAPAEKVAVLIPRHILHFHFLPPEIRWNNKIRTMCPSHKKKTNCCGSYCERNHLTACAISSHSGGNHDKRKQNEAPAWRWVWLICFPSHHRHAIST